jgi:hypothetical protein
MSERLDEPPFVSLEERAGGRHAARAGEPGEKGGGCAGCGCALVVIAALALGIGLWVVQQRDELRSALEDERLARREAERSERRAELERAGRLEPARRGEAPEPREEHRAGEAAPGAARAPAPDPDRALERKLRAIRLATLETSRRAAEGRGRYLAWADLEKGPDEAAPRPEGPLPLPNVDRAAQSIAAAIAHGPETPQVDAAARRWTQAAQALAPLVREAAAYYDEAGHRADGFAGGRALHVRLRAAWASFGSAEEALEAALAEVGDPLEARLIAAAERAPQRGWELRARRAFQAARALAGAHASPTSDLSSDRGKDEIARATGVLSEATQSLSFSPAPPGARPIPGLSTLEQACRELLQASGEVLLQLSKPRELTDFQRQQLRGPNAWRVPGTKEQVEHRFRQVEEIWLKLRIE